MAGATDAMTTYNTSSPLRGVRVAGFIARAPVTSLNLSRLVLTLSISTPPNHHRTLSSSNHARLPHCPSTTTRPPLSASSQALLIMSFSSNSRPRRNICPLDSDVNDLMMCYPCKERYLLQNVQQQAHELASYRDAVDEPHRLHQHSAHAVNGSVPMMESPPSVQPPPLCPPSDRPLPFKVQHEALVPSAPSKRAKLAIVVSDGPRSAVSSTPSVPPSIRSDFSPLQHSPTPDPYIDITRIRMRSQGHHCLYPGATFQGTQKSGRNSYDVTVSIVVG